MNLDLPTIFKFLIAIAVGGILLLSVTFFTPIFFIIGVLVVGYFIYRYLKTGKFGL